jgi:hypothetical protein
MAAAVGGSGGGKEPMAGNVDIAAVADGEGLLARDRSAGGGRLQPLSWEAVPAQPPPAGSGRS